MIIRTGWNLIVDRQLFSVLGSRKLRGEQFYIVRTTRGDKQSIRRSAVLAGIQNGSITISA